MPKFDGLVDAHDFSLAAVREQRVISAQREAITHRKGEFNSATTHLGIPSV